MPVVLNQTSTLSIPPLPAVDLREHGSSFATALAADRTSFILERLTQRAPQFKESLEEALGVTASRGRAQHKFDLKSDCLDYHSVNESEHEKFYPSDVKFVPKHLCRHILELSAKHFQLSSEQSTLLSKHLQADSFKAIQDIIAKHPSESYDDVFGQKIVDHIVNFLSAHIASGFLQTKQFGFSS